MTTKHVPRRFRRFLRASEAVSALEYAILVAVIAVGVGAAIALFQDQIVAAIGTLGTPVGATQVTGTTTVNP